MVWFGILDYPVFLSWGPPIQLVVDVSVMDISCVVASMDKILSRS
jgi:hypothetical protein